jgi:hypothetical protein
MGADHPVSLQTRYMRTRIEAASRDKNKYRHAKQQRSLSDLHKLVKTSSRHVDSRSRDWRLNNLNRARWWAGIELEQEARQHIDWDYRSIQHLAEHVQFLQDVPDTSDRDFFVWSPYVDILMWFNAEETMCKFGERGWYPSRFV